MMRICFATHNDHKLKEVREILGANFDIVGLNDIGCHDEIPENSTTLDENSKIKSDFVFQNFGINCFADDTGLEVEALNNEPGVYSARYAGDQKDSAANMALLLAKLKGKTNRKARFRTIITLIIDGKTRQFEGVVNGEIISEQKGVSGFGYDPIFIPEGYDQTFAEMSSSTKNTISHRGRAVRKLVEFLKLNH